MSRLYEFGGPSTPILKPADGFESLTDFTDALKYAMGPMSHSDPSVFPADVSIPDSIDLQRLDKNALVVDKFKSPFPPPKELAVYDHHSDRSKLYEFRSYTYTKMRHTRVINFAIYQEKKNAP